MTHSTKSANKPKYNSFRFEAIGTHWQIEYASGKGADVELERNISKRIETFDKTYSRFREDSLVHKISQQAGIYEFPADAAPLLALYVQLYKATDGLVSPLVGSTLADAGYDAAYSLRFKQKTPAPPLEVLTITGNVVTTKQPVLLDFGAAGKGYLVDIICEIITSHGITEAVVDAGGDIAVFSKDPAPIDVALQHPEDRSLAIGVAHIQNESLCGSSIHLRNWGTHHHIINPRSAESPTHIRALWVVADTALLADGLSTALFFTDPARLQQHFLFNYAIIKEDYSIEYSPDFPATFFDET